MGIADSLKEQYDRGWRGTMMRPSSARTNVTTGVALPSWIWRSTSCATRCTITAR